jgi:hypothetical protein
MYTYLLGIHNIVSSFEAERTEDEVYEANEISMEMYFDREDYMQEPFFVSLIKLILSYF